MGNNLMQEIGAALVHQSPSAGMRATRTRRAMARSEPAPPRNVSAELAQKALGVGIRLPRQAREDADLCETGRHHGKQTTGLPTVEIAPLIADRQAEEVPKLVASRKAELLASPSSEVVRTARAPPHQMTQSPPISRTAVDACSRCPDRQERVI